ncbi:N-acetyl-gamma-glutamyl-phosphate reductase [Sporanaerobium hydrogeniformans]|uniref:N-acetyl-gamma-glutamyl-phosphate reductase n=1 Tax=Sporanaerobium hydrogeniformans TaxID=3072179 RepID=A0AC61DCB0_9FIRM|nr:N-acetyl-gamma-glutamyl-phosphate reductase [Sporanaerobium hydrogeniformans]PHV70262.1 N-acetyl-gamma-glutamyl-phosphate reductase [Sporanaerobium hydrogeniformans]
MESKKYKVYVDGQAGTTGLQINERLLRHPFVDILKIDEDKRKDLATRKTLINEADVVFLCLPDAASLEAVSLLEPSNNRTKIIDASTAHRLHSNWTYGIPELSTASKEAIAHSNRTSVPGCYASAFILPLYPLVKEGLVPSYYPITSHGISGYSGAGKAVIAEYEASDCQTLYPYHSSPRPYALGLTHKHIPEMQQRVGLDFAPIFTPIICNYYKGLAVATPLHTRLLTQKLTPQDVHSFLAHYYKNQNFVKVMPFDKAKCLDSNFFNPIACNDTNMAELFVFGNDEQIMLYTRLDNLGKGASGAAIQNMNIMLGLDETISLI